MDGMRHHPIPGLNASAIRRLRAPMDVIVDDEMLRITRLPGRSARCVVSFSGVGLSTGAGGAEVQREEFGRSAAEAGDATLLFVIDKTRSWYNDVYERMLDVLIPELQDYRDVATLGNSMGGYAALRFAADLPHCRRAIAFSPQFSVNPDYMPPRERRWKHYREGITDHKLGHALESDTGTVSYWVFCGIDKLPDVPHFESFRDVGLANAQILCLDKCGHDVAQRLQKANLLGPVLEHLLPPRAGGRAALEEMLAASGLPPLDEETFQLRRVAQLERRATRIAALKAKRKADRILQRKQAAISRSQDASISAV